jgi:hypothetical protein
MSIFKTTLSVESTDSSIPVKITATHNNNLLDKIVMSKITIDSNPTEIQLSGEKSRGSFLYVKSSEKNPKQNIVGIASGGGVITLSPGEFAAIPLYTFDNNNGPGGPFGDNSLAAFTTNGTAELEYFTGGRGEDVGESVLVTFKDGSSTWKYFTLDANTAIPGLGLNIFMGNSIGDTGVNTTTYPDRDIEAIVNQKGYIVRFYDVEDGSGLNKFVFINSRGVIVDDVDINQQHTIYNGNGRANLITWYDEDDGHAIYFDGDNYWTHDFININDIYVDDNFNDCAADGTFPLYIEGYDGGTDEALFFVKGADVTLIKTIEAGTSPNWSNSYAYTHGNFIAVETLAEGNQYDEVKTLEIFNTDGTLLKTVEFNDGTEMQNKDYYFYGSGKMQIVYQEENSGDYIFLNYNQLTGKLIGEDLLWKSNNNNDGTYQVVCETYDTGYGKSYKPESVAIILYYDSDFYSNYFLNQDTDGDVEVTYIINNDLEPRNYIVPSTEDRWIARNASYDFLFATDKDFVLLSSDSRNSGPLIATRFASGVEPTRFTLIQELGDYNVSDFQNSGYIESYVFGDYRYLYIRKDAGNGDRDVIVYNSEVLDTITGLPWDDTNTRSEFNNLTVVDYISEEYWYFNTSTKKFVKFPVQGWVWDDDGPSGEGPQYPTGMGKILVTRVKNNTDSVSIWGRVMTKGGAAPEKEMLKFGDQPDFEWNTVYNQMSTETIVLAYKEYFDSPWKVRVFDLNLNLLYEINTEKQTIDTWDNYGKLNYFRFSDSNGNYTHYKFGKLLTTFNQTNPTNISRGFNNMGWW